MTREEEIAKYCEDMGFPLGSCSSINSIKAITASDAIRWADKAMIEKAFEWLCANMVDNTYLGANTLIALNKAEFIQNFKKAMEV